MKARIGVVMSLGVSLGVLFGGCDLGFDPASLLLHNRILAVEADPPEIASGQTTTLSSLHFPSSPTAGVTLDWAYCTKLPNPTGELVNPDCITNESADYIVPIGSGESVKFQMPMETLTSLGVPDASQGLYLPVRVRATGANKSDPTTTTTGVYRLRWQHPPVPILPTNPPNKNPTLMGVYLVPSDGSAPDGGAPSSMGTTPLVESTPQPIHKGETITLRALFTADSAEQYQIVQGDSPSNLMTVTRTETLDIQWYADAGSWSQATTGPDQPDTQYTLTDDAHLPPPGTTINVYVIGRDERGGTAWLHRTLVYMQ